MPILRRRYLFSGEVQGVGFRMTALKIAGSYPVVGYVRNLEDGRVEIVSEGEPSHLASFIRDLHSRIGDRINAVDESQLTLNDDEFDGFSIRY